MSKLKDLIGMRFGRLTVLKRAENNKNGGAKWLCLCDCGSEKVVSSFKLISGVTQSCGCRAREKASVRATRHGRSHTRIYRIWTGMKKRCDKSYDSSYKRYGGRGIKVCEEWYSFESFYEWSINNGYADNLTIDRIDNKGNYEPSNCRWVTAKVQANNTSGNRILSHNGKNQTVAQWCDELNIPRSRIDNRLHWNWSIEKALAVDTVNQRRGNIV
jgi:hypothetical protein